jgi:mRNA interferase HicA
VILPGKMKGIRCQPYMPSKYAIKINYWSMVSFVPKRLSLDIRTYLYDHIAMNGNEFLKKLKKLAKERQVHLELIKAHGKGSHSTLKFGANKTTIKDLKKR